MTKNFFGAMAVATVLFVSCQEKNPNQTIAEKKLESAPTARVSEKAELPPLAQEFIRKHFGSTQIAESKKDIGLSSEYEVKLSDGTSLEFFKDGSLKGVESLNKLPEGIVPAKISAYAVSQFPQNFIKEYKVEDKGQKIELDNGAEVNFDGAGNFVKVD